MHISRTFQSIKQRQHGAVFIVMMVIMVLGTATFLVSSLNSASLQIARDSTTADAMAQAKEALIGYAVKVQLSNSNASCSPNCTRPGDLPCPDTNNDGSAESSCGSASGSDQWRRIGRLPWKTLGLPDLRDGSGERLWYAVSNNFKNNTRTTCTSPGQAGCLNSDTVGTISISTPDGTRIYDGGGNTGAVAVIIAPGDVLTRQGGALQDRSGPDNGAAKNTASNYLDIATIGGNTEDNANFTDGSSSDGFIQGRIKDGNGNTIVNDQLLVISQENIMPPIQKRVAAEVRLCLEDYANNNNGRYPWTAPITDLGSTYNDNNDEYFGRIPDRLENTHDDSYIGWPSFTYLMQDHWGTCNTHSNQTPSGWWINWKEMVFYGVARRFRPNDTPPPPPSFPATCATPGNCLNINTSAIPARFVVIVAGRKLSNPDQTLRNANKTNAFYYLEGGNENADPDPPSNVSNLFIQSTPSATFNDTLVYQ